MNKTAKKVIIILHEEDSFKPIAVKPHRQVEYVDPYLYEVGFFASSAERAQLVAATPIKPCK